LVLIAQAVFLLEHGQTDRQTQLTALPHAGTSSPQTQIFIPNGISISSAVFAGLTNVPNMQTHTQTDRPRYSMCSNTSLSPAIAVIWPKILTV